MAEITYKAFVESTIGVCQEMVDTAEQEGRDFTDTEQTQFDTLLGSYRVATGRNVPSDIPAFKSFCQQPDPNSKGTLHHPMTGVGNGSRMPGNEPTGLVFQTPDGQRVQSYRHGENIGGTDSSLIGSSSSDTPSLGACLHHMITGSDKFLDGDMASALVPGSSDTKGFLLQQRLGNTVYDLARAHSTVSKAGANTISIDGPDLTLASVASDPTAYWRHETVPVTASSLTFSAKVLRPRTLAVLIPLSVELVEDASNITTLLEGIVASAIGAEIDRAALLGVSAGGEAGGIFNEEGINEVAAVGTPTDYSEASTAVQNILAANYGGEDASGLAWIANPRDFATYDGLTDTTGQPLNPTPWASQLRKLSTTKLAENGSSETDMIVGDFTQAILGFKSQGLRFELFREGSVTDSDSTTWNATTQLLVHLRAYIRMDTAFIKPQFFTKMTGVTNS